MKMENNALLLGSVFGIPVRLHMSLLVVVGALSLLTALGGDILTVPVFAIGIIGSVVLHELGHSLVARKKGGYIHEIVLYPFGGAAKISNIPVKPIDEILVALAGPAVSLVLAVLFSGFGGVLAYISNANLFLFGFNILPVFPMDGGRVLRASLSTRKGRVEATRIAVTVGKYFCILFVVVGLFGLNLGALGLQPNLVLAFIGGYIYLAGKTEYRQVLLEHQASHFSGFRENRIDVEVSPPPYADHDNARTFFQKTKDLFR